MFNQEPILVNFNINYVPIIIIVVMIFIVLFTLYNHIKLLNPLISIVCFVFTLILGFSALSMEFDINPTFIIYFVFFIIVIEGIFFMFNMYELYNQRFKK